MEYCTTVNMQCNKAILVEDDGEEEERRRREEEEKRRREEEEKKKKEGRREKKNRGRGEEEESKRRKERIDLLEQLVESYEIMEILLNDLKSEITRNSTLNCELPQKDGIKLEGNTITHSGSDSYRNCFIGGKLSLFDTLFFSSVTHFLHFLPSFSIPLLFFFLGNLSDVYITPLLHSLSFHLSISTFILRRKNRNSFLFISLLIHSLSILSGLDGTPILGLIDSSFPYPISQDFIQDSRGFHPF